MTPDWKKLKADADAKRVEAKRLLDEAAAEEKQEVQEIAAQKAAPVPTPVKPALRTPSDNSIGPSVYETFQKVARLMKGWK